MHIDELGYPCREFAKVHSLGRNVAYRVRAFSTYDTSVGKNIFLVYVPQSRRTYRNTLFEVCPEI